MSRRNRKENRIGETIINNNGEKMTIIAYRNCKDIDVIFEDKVVVTNKRYAHFLNGNIAHPIRYEQSFAYYLEVELGLDINKIWNFKKNIVSPYEIAKCGDKKVWLYCQEKDYHNVNGGYQITCHDFNRGSRCSYCGTRKTHKLDSLAYLYPQIAEMIVADERNNVTMEDMYKISPQSSSKKFYFKCDKCGKVSSKKKDLNSVIGYKFSCEYCSDGISTPEKFMISILKQLNIEFITQLNKSTFKWCQNYKYDFYIPSLSMIIETHGLQHYNNNFKNIGGRTLEEEQENDRLKKELALNNNIKSFVVVDCRKSELEWLKENVIKEFNEYFDLSNIEWELAWKDSLKSLVWEVEKLIKENCDNRKIMKILNIGESTVIKYKRFLKTINII